MEFDNFLKGKKIDPEKFKLSENDRYSEWKRIYDAVHPESFTQQKLFLLNKIRRAYHFKESQEGKKPIAPKTIRPKIKPLKPKTK